MNISHTVDPPAAWAQTDPQSSRRTWTLLAPNISDVVHPLTSDDVDFSVERHRGVVGPGSEHGGHLRPAALPRGVPPGLRGRPRVSLRAPRTPWEPKRGVTSSQNTLPEGGYLQGGCEAEGGYLQGGCEAELQKTHL